MVNSDLIMASNLRNFVAMIKTRSIFNAALPFAVWLISLNTTSAQLPQQEEAFLMRADTTLHFSDGQREATRKVYLTHQSELNQLQAELDSLEKFETNESMLQLKMNVINQQKKDVRDQRELEFLALLTEAQRATYEERIKPQKPQVLHFGIHDRAKCNVCNK